MTNEEAARLLEDMYIYRTRKIPSRYKPTKEALKVAVEVLKRNSQQITQIVYCDGREDHMEEYDEEENREEAEE